MQADTIHKLLDLNEQFYQTFALQFSQTRQRLQPGVTALLPALLKEVRHDDEKYEALVQKPGKESAEKLKKAKLNPEELAKRPLRYEKLDQLLHEVLMGARG